MDDALGQTQTKITPDRETLVDDPQGQTQNKITPDRETLVDDPLGKTQTKEILNKELLRTVYTMDAQARRASRAVKNTIVLTSVTTIAHVGNTANLDFVKMILVFRMNRL